MGDQLGPLSMAIGAARPHRAADGSILKDWRMRSADLLREAFLSMCETVAPEVLLECGAHAAETSVAFVARTRGRAIALEANPYTYDELTLPSSGPRLDVRNVGIGATEGEADFLIPLFMGTRTPGLASFLERADQETAYERVPVRITTVDAVAAQLDPTDRVALWIDVEGLSVDALRGAAHLLASGRCPLVFVEIEHRPLWHDQGSATEVDDLLGTHGYSPVMRDAEYSRQCNVIYVHRSIRASLDDRIIDYWDALAAIKVRERSPLEKRIRVRLGPLKARLVPSRNRG